MGARRVKSGPISAVVAVFIMLLLGAAPVRAQTGAHELVKTTTDQVLAELNKRRAELKDQPGKIYEFVERYLLPHFDFERMSRLVLGKHWRRIDEDQRTRFVKEFQRLLIRTYASSMLKYSDENIYFLPYNGGPNPDDVIVKTEVEQPGGSPIPIDYRLYKVNGSWKVYDVAIDGVSLVINYRSSFSQQIARLGGVDPLIDKLRERNRELTNE